MKPAMTLLIIFSLLISSSFVESRANESNPVPILNVESVLHNHGKIEKGETISHAFIIRNNGKGKLEIKDARPDWGCSIARFDRVIPPGEEGKVVLEINTERLNGKITKGVTIETNDPAWPQLKFLLTAEIESLFEISPDRQAFINIQQGDSWSKVFTIKSIDGQPFTILKIDHSGKYLSAAYKPKIPDDKTQYEIIITGKEDIPLGDIREEIHIYTDLSKDFPEDIEIYGKIQGNIVFYPERVTLFSNAMYTGRITSQNIHIMKKDGSDFKITGIKIPHKEIRYGVIEVEEGRSYILAVIWEIKENQEKINGNITLFTNDQEMPQIVIPYSCIN